MPRVSKQVREEAIQICEVIAFTPGYISRRRVVDTLELSTKSNDLAYLAVSAINTSKGNSFTWLVNSEVERRMLYAEAAQNLANGWKPGADWC